MSETNSRRNPRYCYTIAEAHAIAKAENQALWFRVWGWTGIYHVYPGGRKVHYPNG